MDMNADGCPQEQLLNVAGNLATGGTTATLPVIAAMGPPDANA